MDYTFNSQFTFNNSSKLEEKKTSLLEKVLSKRDELGYSTADLTNRQVEVLDGDTLRVKASPTDLAQNPNETHFDIRLKPNDFNASYDAYENKLHTDNIDARTEAKLSKQRQAIEDNEWFKGWFNPATNEDVFERGQVTQQKLQDTINAQQGLKIKYQGLDQNNRVLADILDSRSNESITNALNTEEDNASYNTKYNEGFRKQVDSTPLESLQDAATSFGIGATVLSGQALVGTADLAQGLLKKSLGIEDTPSITDYLQEVGYDPLKTKQVLDETFHTDKFLTKQKKLQEAMSSSDDEWENAKNTAKFLLDNPEHLITGTVMESLPMMFQGGLLAKASKNPLLVGAITEGTQSAGMIADTADIQGRTQEQYVTPSIAAGIGTGAINLGMNSLAGDALISAVTKGQAGKTTLTKALFGEATEEALQTAQEQVFTNIAEGEEDIFKGIGSNTVLGAAAGAATGGPIQAVHSTANTLSNALKPKEIQTPAQEDTVQSEQSSNDLGGISNTVLEEDDNVADYTSAIKPKSFGIQDETFTQYGIVDEDTKQNVRNEFAEMDSLLKDSKQVENIQQTIYDDSSKEELLNKLNTVNFGNLSPEAEKNLSIISDKFRNDYNNSTELTDPFIKNELNIDSSNLDPEATEIARKVAKGELDSNFDLPALTQAISKNIEPEAKPDNISLMEHLLTNVVKNEPSKLNDTSFQSKLISGLNTLQSIKQGTIPKVDENTTPEEFKFILENNLGSLNWTKEQRTEIDNGIKILEEQIKKEPNNEELKKILNNYKRYEGFISALENTKDINTVSSEVLNGSTTEGGQRKPSANQWLQLITLKSNDKNTANKLLGQLTNWSKYHSKKSTLLSQISSVLESRVDELPETLIEESRDTNTELGKLFTKLEEVQKDGGAFSTKVNAKQYQLIGDAEDGKHLYNAFDKLTRQVNFEANYLKNTIKLAKGIINSELVSESSTIDSKPQNQESSIDASTEETNQSKPKYEDTQPITLQGIINEFDPENADKEFPEYKQDQLTDSNEINNSDKQMDMFDSKKEGRINSLKTNIGTIQKNGLLKRLQTKLAHIESTGVLTQQEQNIVNNYENKKEELHSWFKELKEIVSIERYKSYIQSLVTDKIFTQEEFNSYFPKQEKEEIKTEEPKEESWNLFTSKGEEFALVNSKDKTNVYTLLPTKLDERHPLKDKPLHNLFTLGKPKLIHTTKDLLKNLLNLVNIENSLESFESIKKFQFFTQEFISKWKSSFDLRTPKGFARYVEDNPSVALLLKQDKSKDNPENILTAISLASLNWLNSSKITAHNDQTAVNQIFGWDDNAEEDSEIYTFMSQMGSIRSVMANQLGKAISKSLGLKPSKDIDQDIIAKFELSLGLEAIDILEKLGLVEYKAIPNRIFNLMKNGEPDKEIPPYLPEESKPLTANTKEERESLYKESVVFVKVKTELNKKGKLDIAENVSNILKDTKEALPILNKLLGTEYFESKPTNKPLTQQEFNERFSATINEHNDYEFETNKTWDRSNTEYSSEDLKALFNYQQVGWKVNTPALDLFNKLTDDTQERIYTGRDKDSLVQQHFKESVEGKELSWKLDKQSLDEAIEIGNEREGKVYFQSSIWKQGRVGMKGGPQNNKMMRWLFAPESWNLTINPSKDTELFRSFQLAVIAAFGGKPENINFKAQEGQDLLSEFTEIYLNNESLQTVLEDLSINGKITNEQALIKAIDEGGEGFHTLAGILALASYMKSIEDGKESFETNLGFESDGKTNGVAIGLMMLSGITDYNNLGQQNLLNASGAYSNNQSYSEWINNDPETKQKDNYEQISDLVNEGKTIHEQAITYFSSITRADARNAEQVIKQRKRNIEPDKIQKEIEWYFINQFFNSLPIEQQIPSIKNLVRDAFNQRKTFNIAQLNAVHNLIGEIKRSFSKYPLMITTFGSSIQKVADSISNDLIDKIYESIDKEINSDNINLDVLQNIENNLFNILGHHTQLNDLIFTLDLDSLANFEVNKNDITSIKKLVSEIYKPIMDSAISQNYSEFISNRKEINNAFALMNNMFEQIRVARIKEIESEKKRGISRTEFNELMEELRPLQPAVDTPTSNGNLKQKLQLWSKSTSSASENKMRVQVENTPEGYRTIQYYYQLDGEQHSVGVDIGSISGNAEKFILEEIGVRPAIMSIHNMDSYPIKDMMKSTYEFLGVHDAKITGLDVIKETDIKMNKALYERIANFDLFGAVYDSIYQASKFIAQNKYTLDKSKLEKYLKISNQEFDSVKKYLQAFKEFAESKEQQKQEQILDKITSFSNYGGIYPYIIKEEKEIFHIDTIVEKIVESENEISTESNQESNTDKETLGSTPGVSSTNPFIGDNSILTSENVEASLEKLFTEDRNIVDSVEHQDYLRDTIKNLITKVMKPIEYYQTKDGDTTYGFIDPTFSRVAVNIAQTVNQNYSGIKMSAATTYVHELIHAVTGIALTSPEHFNLYRETVRLFNHVKSNLTSEQIERYAYVFKNDQTVRQTYTNTKGIQQEHIYNQGILEFIAYAKSEPELMKLIEVIPDMKDIRLQDMPLNQAISSIFNRIIDWFNRTILNKDLSTRGRIDAITLALSTAHIKRKPSLLGKLVIPDTWNKYVIEKAKDLIAKPLLDLNQKINNKSSNRNIKNTTNTIANLVNADWKNINASFREGARKLGVIDNNIASSITSEIAGSTEDMKKFHKQIAVRQVLRDHFVNKAIETVSKILSDAFTKKLTKEVSETITKVGIKGDISYLSKIYSDEDLIKLLSDETFRQEEISNLQDKLIANPYRQYFINQVRNLGSFMINNTFLKEEHINAHNVDLIINNVSLIDEHYKPEENLRNTLKQLSRLYAIEFMQQSDKESFVKLLNEEKEGIATTLKGHDNYKKNYLNKILKGNKLLVVDGAIKESYNPNRSLVIANNKEGKGLVKQGYYKNPIKLKRSGIDNSDSDMYLWFADVKMLQTYQQAGTAFTELNDSLSNFMEGYTASDSTKQIMSKLSKNAIPRNALKDAIRLSNSRTNRNSPEEQNSLTPKYNQDGRIIGFTYTLHESIKDEYLDRVMKHDYVMASMNASIIDQLATKPINERMVDTLIQDQKEFVRYPKLFVQIGPDSPNKEYRDIWFRLPKQTKEMVKEKTGFDYLMVREEALDYVFGYRKVSAANWIRPYTVEELANHKHIKQLGNWIFDHLNPNNKFMNMHNLRKVESGIQEAVKMAKDTIVIKLPKTLIANELSNTVTLHTRGIPADFIIKEKAEALTNAKLYFKTTKEISELKYLMDIDSKYNTKENQFKVVQLETLQTQNPVHQLVKEGVFQTIVEDIAANEGLWNWKSRYEDKLEKLGEKVPKIVKETGKFIAMTHDTKMYKFLHDTTQVSDLTARYVLHKWNLQQGMKLEESLDDIVSTFVNYELPTHRFIEYGNEMGVFMFTKYFFRILKPMVKETLRHPLNVAALHMLQMFYMFESVHNIEFTDVFNKINDPFSTIFSIIDANPFYQATT